MNIQDLYRGRGLWRSLGVAAALTAGLTLYGTGSHLQAGSAAAVQSARPRASAPSAVSVTAPRAVTSYADAVSEAAPSVVTVQIEKKATQASLSGLEADPFFQRFFGGGSGDTPRQSRNRVAPVEHALGSGVIVSADGNILTNNHVVDGANRVTVTLSNGTDYSAKVVGTDPASDLAVVHIDATDLPALRLGDSDAVRVGDVVLAVGNPLGVGQTVTMGIISAKDRTTGVGDGSYEDFLQTDAPINEGNSGGALITATGELIGINSQIMSPSGGNIGIGFAIPSNMAKNVMDQLITSGRVRRAILGITVQPMTSDLAKSLNLSGMHGALVNSVDPAGQAAKAGLKSGDVIVKVNGDTIEDSNQLRNRISAMEPGAAVTLAISRDGHAQNVTVNLGEPTPSARAEESRPADASASLGLTVEPLTPAIAQQLRVPSTTEGLAVSSVDPSSAAARVGIREGDVIRQVNGRPVKSSSDLHEALAGHGDRPALVYVQRGANSFYVPLPNNS